MAGAGRFGGLEGLLSAGSLQTLSAAAPAAADGELTRNLSRFAKIVARRAGRLSCEMSHRLCSLALDAYERGGTSTLYLRFLADLETDLQVDSWASCKMAAGFGFAASKRRDARFKIHEWILLRSRMQSLDQTGVFRTDMSAAGVKRDCAARLRGWRAAYENSGFNATVSALLDEDTRSKTSLWLKGARPIPMSDWLVVQALCEGVISEKEAYLLDYELLRSQRLPDSCRKVLWLLWE